MTGGTVGVPAVRLSRFPRRGVLLGQSVLQVVIIGIAVASLVVGLYAAGRCGLVWLLVGGRRLVD
ncbi:MAG: hypothetical protein ACR2HR_06740 [Euzebya sp.]